MNEDKNAHTLLCEKLTKSYKLGYPPVLDNFSISLAPGKIVGLLGPNGCGKSTLMKLIMGLLTTDLGTIKICGRHRSSYTNSLISYLPERTYLNPAMTVDELIRYFSDFYSDFEPARAKKMLDELGIKTASTLRTLSKGNKEKVQLIMVMSRRAKLYLLDEPIAGVDPAAREYILNTIIGNYNPEATVLITTHLIHDVEGILDEFYFMDYGGKILLFGDRRAICEEKKTSLDELFKEVFRCSRSF